MVQPALKRADADAATAATSHCFTRIARRAERALALTRCVVRGAEDALQLELRAALEHELNFVEVRGGVAQHFAREEAASAALIDVGERLKEVRGEGAPLDILLPHPEPLERGDAPLLLIARETNRAVLVAEQDAEAEGVPIAQPNDGELWCAGVQLVYECAGREVREALRGDDDARACQEERVFDETLEDPLLLHDEDARRAGEDFALEVSLEDGRGNRERRRRATAPALHRAAAAATAKAHVPRDAPPRAREDAEMKARDAKDVGESLQRPDALVVAHEELLREVVELALRHALPRAKERDEEAHLLQQQNRGPRRRDFALPRRVRRHAQHLRRLVKDRHRARGHAQMRALPAHHHLSHQIVAQALHRCQRPRRGRATRG